MIRLTALGTLDLRHDDGTTIDIVVRQPRRFALLIYLAVESRRGFLRRDRILNLFWPETDTAQGRRSLSQSLHYLRQALGPDAIQSRGAEDLQLDLGRVSCDVCDFLDAAEGDDPELASRLFTGELLPGFFCSGIPDFEHWLDLQRTELRRLASDSGWAAAERACDRREWVTAAALARRAAELAGGDEASVRRLMSFLAGIGDRAGALDAFDNLARQLRREYDAEPCDVTRRLAADIREQEHTRAAAIEPFTLSTAPAPAESTHVAALLQQPEPAPAEVTARRPGLLRRNLDRVRTVVVSAVLMVAFVSLWALGRPNAASEPLSTSARLLLEEPRSGAALSPALSAELVRQLDGIERIDVLVDGGESAPLAGTADLSLRSVFTEARDSLSATLSIVDRASGRSIGTARVTGETRTPEGTTRMAEAIARFARRAIGDELRDRRARLSGVGRQELLDLNEARRQVALADSLDELGKREVSRLQYAAADSQLALVQARTGSWAELPIERAELAYRRMWAYLIPPGDDERTARSTVVQGITHASRAIELAPDDARGFELRGVLRFFLWSTAPRDSIASSAPLAQLARADLERATSLSRKSARAWNYLSNISFYQGDFPRAYIAARNAIAADEFLDNDLPNYVTLFWSGLEIGDLAGAERGCQGISRYYGDSWVDEYCRLALTAWDPARYPLGARALELLVDSAYTSSSVTGDSSRISALHAVILAHAGRNDEARSVLARLEREHGHDTNYLLDIAWIYSALHENARANELLERLTEQGPPGRAAPRHSGRFRSPRS